MATHLTLNEREQRVKKTSDPVERTRFLAVSHATQGLTATAIATTTVPSTRWVQQVVRRDNQESPAALKDRWHTTPGQRPTLTLEEQQRVSAALQGPPPDGGWWTGTTLRVWVARELGKKRSRSPTSRLVHELGVAHRVPRPQQRQRDAQVQVACTKPRSQAVEAARKESRRGTLIADDEHRLGRPPVYRRVWRRTRERPTAVVAHRSHWCSVYTVVEPTTGWNLRRVVNGIDTQVMSWVVTALTATVADGEDAWVVLDRAG